MTKVDCLKELAEKLGVETLTADDTVCEILHKIAGALDGSSAKVENVSNRISIVPSDNANVTLGDIELVTAKKTGRVYTVDLYVKFTLAEAVQQTYFSPFKISMDDFNGFYGAVAQAVVILPAHGQATTAILMVGGEPETHSTVLYCSGSLGAGEYTVNASFTFIL